MTQKALNDDCKRYNLPSIDFNFYDVKLFYKEYKNTNREISVLNILNELDLKGEEGEHDAEVDAYNTMIEFKEMLNKLGFSLTEMIDLCPNVKDGNENYTILSLCSKKTDNISKKCRKFSRDLKHIAEKYPDRFSWKAICISDTIKGTDYELRIALIKEIFKNGYNYTCKASECDYFVHNDEYGERDLSCDHNIEDNHKDIKKITIEELSKMLKIEINEHGEYIKDENNYKNTAFNIALIESLKKKGISYENWLKQFKN